MNEAPATTSFLSEDELAGLGLGSCGHDVLVSRHARFYYADRVHVGNHVRIDDFALISAGQDVRLGSHVHIAAYVALFGSEGIELADFCGLSSRVTVYTTSDDFSGRSLTGPTVPVVARPGLARGRVTLERHVVVGAHSVLMPGVTLHEGAAVGALSFVTRDCEAWTLYSGTPAKPLKPRSRALLDLARGIEAKEVP